LDLSINIYFYVIRINIYKKIFFYINIKNYKSYNITKFFKKKKKKKKKKKILKKKKKKKKRKKILI